MKKDQKRPFPREQIPSLLFLVGIVMMRTWTQFGLVTYIPFYYIDFLKESPLYAGKLVTTLLMAGALGTLLGAPLADRWGHKKFLSATLILAFPFLLLFYHTPGFFIFVLLGIAGMILGSTFGVTVVMAQSLIPQHLGIASGLMVGFAIGTGGIGVTLLGSIADHWGVPAALKTIFFLPLIGFALTLLMKYSPLRTKD